MVLNRGAMGYLKIVGAGLVIVAAGAVLGYVLTASLRYLIALFI